MDFSYRLGYRAIKTAIAVAVCLFLSYIFGRSTAVFAVVAAILCIQPTYDKSKHTGFHRVIGTLIGSGFSLLTLELAGIIPYYNEFLYIIIFPLMMLALIFVCNVLNLKDSVAPSCVIFAVIVFFHTGSALDTVPYVINRTHETLAGVFVALPINRFILNPKEPGHADEQENQG